MQFNRLKFTLKSAAQALAVLLLGTGWAAGQQQVNLTRRIGRIIDEDIREDWRVLGKPLLGSQQHLLN